jgi:hypothetical protein
MNKNQRYRYEMFVRVRDFGAANREVFPKSSTGSQLFARMAAAVAAVEGHLSDSVVARAEARKIGAATRARVRQYLRTIAATGRQAARREAVGNVFRLPRRRSDKALVATARVFIGEARRREAEFVRLGLPSTFMADFESVMNDLDQAVNVRNNSAHLRRKAQAGIETALTLGFESLGELDVVVPNALRDDPVRLAQWRRARHIDGQGSSSSASAAKSRLATPPVEAPTASTTDPPEADTTRDAAVSAGEEVTTASDEGAVLRPAS